MVLDTESKYWSKLTIEYMSEESDCSGDETSMIMHVLPWRSQGQYNYIIGWLKFINIVDEKLSM